MRLMEAELWTAREAAAWMKCSRATFYRHRAHPDFPQSHRPPGGGHPRWIAAEIMGWWFGRYPQITPKAA